MIPCAYGDNYEYFTLPSGTLGTPAAVSKCRDINLASGWGTSTNARAVKVCFKTAGCNLGPLVIRGRLTARGAYPRPFRSWRAMTMRWTWLVPS